ncbi:tRNA (guanosine(46)-N7)-methyltransferase TrmB [Hugenholtzia roseola]|uniref:tRNA (guanosine(46)-N7)-methyltransferase TrmB n=1 Tax=Hugenholtzia roseola TaxID=1002 RepID=UPI00047A6B1E|nr:tRNA (guanosine(46)-N7)-methyltransferase TrmB [Hugenholtzia roseola]
MARKKLIRFGENLTRSNVFEPEKEGYTELIGTWREKVFQNTNPLILELACGYGEYSVGLAAQKPDQNFIGIDIKGERLWKGSTDALTLGLSNVAFLRTQIHHLERFFLPNEVSEIWLIHPDPRPRNRDIRRRLTAERFLSMYQKILKPEGGFRLKTDSDLLFEFTLETLKKYPIKNLEYTWDLYQSPLLEEHYGITTRYERRAQGEGLTIKFLKCNFEK